MVKDVRVITYVMEIAAHVMPCVILNLVHVIIHAILKDVHAIPHAIIRPFLDVHVILHAMDIYQPDLLLHCE
jgi:hypothetical protein